MQDTDPRARQRPPSQPGHGRTPSVTARGGTPGAVDEGLPSVARLEAEAAFVARPPVSGPQSQTRVTVRRGRIARTPSVAGPDGSDLELTPVGKGPRVFRLDAQRPPANGPDLPIVALGGAEPQDGSATAPRPPKRRRAVDRRPGPVVRLVPPPARAEGPPTPRQLAELAAALAGIDPVLQAIERAQALVFLDDDFAGDWQVLSLRAGRLLEEIRSREGLRSEGRDGEPRPPRRARGVRRTAPA